VELPRHWDGKSSISVSLGTDESAFVISGIKKFNHVIFSKIGKWDSNLPIDSTVSSFPNFFSIEIVKGRTRMRHMETVTGITDLVIVTTNPKLKTAMNFVRLRMQSLCQSFYPHTENGVQHMYSLM